jgi:hypothetical protein
MSEEARITRKEFFERVWQKQRWDKGNRRREAIMDQKARNTNRQEKLDRITRSLDELLNGFTNLSIAEARFNEEVFLMQLQDDTRKESFEDMKSSALGETTVVWDKKNARREAIMAQRARKAQTP